MLCPFSVSGNIISLYKFSEEEDGARGMRKPMEASKVTLQNNSMFMLAK